MDDREWLRMTISLALTAVPRSTRRAFAERPTGVSDPAREDIADAVAAAIEREFALDRRLRRHAADGAHSTPCVPVPAATATEPREAGS